MTFPYLVQVLWGTWKAEHPHTLAMTNGKEGTFSRKERPRDNWVIGIALGEHHKAYDYLSLANLGVVNDFVGPYPVALYVDPETRNVHAYLRQVGDQVLTLVLAETGEYLIDSETGTTWDIARGLAREGTLQGETMLLVPYLSSFDWAWLDFYPNSEFYP
jgi:hypothetical protein